MSWGCFFLSFVSLTRKRREAFFCSFCRRETHERCFQSSEWKVKVKALFLLISYPHTKAVDKYVCMQFALELALERTLAPLLLNTMSNIIKFLSVKIRNKQHSCCMKVFKVKQTKLNQLLISHSVTGHSKNFDKAAQIYNN